MTRTSLNRVSAIDEICINNETENLEVNVSERIVK